MRFFVKNAFLPVLWTVVLISVGFSQIRLTDVGTSSGIDFRHTDGGTGQRYIVESVVGGLAFFDFDNDGLIDIYFLNGSELGNATSNQTSSNRLFRNEGSFQFRDVTKEAGLHDLLFSMGVVAGDYDNDGDWDLYVSNFGVDSFYENCGDGRFTLATSRLGKLDPSVGAGCVLTDIDNDGNLDLYCGRYVEFTLDKHITRMIGKHQFHPGPTDYPPARDQLLRNSGNGVFEDISKLSGIDSIATSSMGVIAFDVDDDGDTDVFVANDQMPNSLWINDGSGTFVESALQLGVAIDRSGKSNGNMGVECGDIDGDGMVDMLTTTYQDEMPILYKNLGVGLFNDVTHLSGIDRKLFSKVTWGCGLVDFDNDFDKDLYIACGHFMDNIEMIDDRTKVRERDFLLENAGEGRFRDVSNLAGSGMSIVKSSRGAAFDDLDNDGDIDAVVLNVNDQPSVLRNDSQGGDSLRVQLIGTKSNRFAIGAKVTLTMLAKSHVSFVCAGRGYQSHYGTEVHFGLGKFNEGENKLSIEVRWPHGTKELFIVQRTTTSNDRVILIEGAGQQSMGE